jgi:hypothetical protein
MRLDSGEPCFISVAQTGVRVKKTRFGFLGSILLVDQQMKPPLGGVQRPLKQSEMRWFA